MNQFKRSKKLNIGLSLVMIVSMLFLTYADYLSFAVPVVEGAWEDALIIWDNNGNSGTSPTPRISDAQVVNSAADATTSAGPLTTSNLARINQYDININAAAIPATPNTSSYIEYSFTTTDMLGIEAQLYGIGAAVFNDGGSSGSNQDTGQYKVQILIDEDPTFSSPTTLVNEIAFNDGDMSWADFADPVQQQDWYQYTYGHVYTENVIDLQPTTTYYIRVYPYSFARTGRDPGQPFPQVVLFDDFSVKIDSFAAPPTIGITKTADTTADLSPGDVITYTVEVSNNDLYGGVATDIEITDSLPAGLTLVDGSITREYWTGQTEFSDSYQMEFGSTAFGLTSANSGAIQTFDTTGIVPDGAVLDALSWSASGGWADMLNDMSLSVTYPSGTAFSTTSGSSFFGGWTQGPFYASGGPYTDVSGPAAGIYQFIWDDAVDRRANDYEHWVNEASIRIEYTVPADRTQTFDQNGSIPTLMAATEGIDLAPGESILITYQAVVDSNLDPLITEITNTATVVSNENTATSSSVTHQVDKTSLMTFDKSADKSILLLGDTITYTFTVTNDGTEVLNNVAVTDPMFPGGITLDKTTLLPGEVAIGTAQHIVTQADMDAGAILNTATATSVNYLAETLTIEDSVLIKIEPKPTTPFSNDNAIISKTATISETPTEYWIDLRVEGETLAIEQTMDIVLALDNSTSMNNADTATGETRAQITHDAATEFINTMLSTENNPFGTTQISLVTFGNDVIPENTTGLTTDSVLLTSLIPTSAPTTNGTNTQAALKEARDILATSTADYKTIIVLSDGVPTYSYRVANGGLVSNTGTNTIVSYDGIAAPAYKGQVFDYNNLLGEGTGFYLNQTFDEYWANTVTNQWMPVTDHGFATMSEALLAKDQGIEIFSFGIEIADQNINGRLVTRAQALNVLKNIASGEDHYFDAVDATNVSSQLANLALSYTNSVINGIIIDPMSQFVDLIKAGAVLTDTDYTITASDGSIIGAGLLTDIQIVESPLGTLQVTGINLGDTEWVNIRYKVSLKDEYQDGTYYPTNDTTTLQTNGDDPSTVIEFDIPEVKYMANLVQLTKTFAGSAPSTGEVAIFELYRVVGQIDSTLNSENDDIILGTYTTNNSGLINVKNVASGDYYFLEINTDADYLPFEEPLPFSVVGGVANELISIALDNERKNPEMTVEKTAGVEVATSLGEEIPYQIVVTNTGNIPLNNIIIDDTLIGPFTGPFGDLNSDGVLNPGEIWFDGDLNSDGILDTGEIWTYDYIYIVQKSDFDAYGEGQIINVVNVDSDETEPVIANSTIPVDIQDSILNITKLVTGTADTSVPFTIKVLNTALGYSVDVVVHANETVQLKVPVGDYAIYESAIPMEYDQTGASYEIYSDAVIVDSGQIPANNIVSIFYPEANVTFTNAFEHDTYFHNTDSVTNTFN